jgi:hypothetical protein
MSGFASRVATVSDVKLCRWICRHNLAAARGGKRAGEGGKFRVPRRSLSEHSIEHDEDFAHAGGERDFGFLARRNQSRVCP